MTALAVAARLFDPLDGDPTLDEVLVSAWEGITAHRTVECPVCGGEMEPKYGAQARPAGGGCNSCGATIC